MPRTDMFGIHSRPGLVAEQAADPGLFRFEGVSNLTVSEMVAQLALRLEDSDKDNWTDSEKLAALNNAQYRVANLVHDKYLTELEVTEENVVVSGGKVDLVTGLSNTVLKGAEGIKKVRISNGLWCIESEIEHIKRQENRYHKGTLHNPMFYTFQNTLYLLPDTVSAVDIYYLRKPKPLLNEFTMAPASPASATEFLGTAGEGLSTSDDAYNGSTDKERAVIYCIGKKAYFIVTDYDYTGNAKGEMLFTVSPAADTNFGTDIFYFNTHSFDELGLDNLSPEINVDLHPIMLDFAEGECWGMANELDRKNSVFKSAYQEIEILNAKYREAVGVGAKSRKRG